MIETGSLFYVVEAMKKDPDVYAALRKCAEEGPSLDEPDDEPWIDYDIAFHRALVGASGIAPLASFCDLLEAFFQKIRGTVPSNPHVTDMHIEIVEALGTAETRHGRRSAAESTSAATRRARTIDLTFL